MPGQPPLARALVSQPTRSSTLHRALRELEGWFTYDEAATYVVAWHGNNGTVTRELRDWIAAVIRNLAESGDLEVHPIRGGHAMRYRWPVGE